MFKEPEEIVATALRFIFSWFAIDLVSIYIVYRTDL